MVMDQMQVKFGLNKKLMVIFVCIILSSLVFHILAVILVYPYTNMSMITSYTAV